jgi:hypothetical protein
LNQVPEAILCKEGERLSLEAAGEGDHGLGSPRM